MTTYRFTTLSRTVRKRVACQECGRKVTRQQTFSQTLNPFNRNSSSEVKTSDEIYSELAAEAAAWLPEAICPTCSASTTERSDDSPTPGSAEPPESWATEGNRRALETAPWAAPAAPEGEQEDEQR